MYAKVLLLSACTAQCALASPIHARQAAPSVTIKNGTIIGSTNAGIDSFLGIPFASPPVGPLRLKSPQPLATPLGTYQATASPSACPQPTSTAGLLSSFNAPLAQIEALLGPLGSLVTLVRQLPLFTVASVRQVSENCLSLNVYRPASASASSKLPVLAYIYGGGFVAGSNLDANGSYFVQNSAAIGHPYIWVAMNYRLGGFGFLAGTELAQDGSTNLGLKDQRLALQWIQENIAAFGGDPTKVTLWGHSAGSISVMDQTIINNGDNNYNGKPLFRGGMMNSGTIVPALAVDSSRAQALFDNVVQTSGCSSATSKLDCLRALPYDKFYSSTTAAPANLGYQVIDFAYIPRPDPTSSFFPASPEAAVASGNFARVPIIAGDVEDEGTLFCLYSNIQTSDALTDALTTHFPGATRNDIAAVLATYPDDPAEGSPFRTGTANNIYPEFKRLSAVYGDTLFTLLRRAYLSAVAPYVSAYSYLDTYYYGTDTVGTYHSSDLFVTSLPQPGVIVPRDSANTYYASFVNFAQPNGIASPYPAWKAWTAESPQLLNFSIANVEYIPDDFRAEQYGAVLSYLDKLKL